MMRKLNFIGFFMCTVSLFTAVSHDDWALAAILGVFSLGNFLCWAGVEE